MQGNSGNQARLRIPKPALHAGRRRREVHVQCGERRDGSSGLEEACERLFKIAKDTSYDRQRVFANWALTGATMFLWSEYGLPSAAQEEFARCWLRWLWRSTSSDHEYRTRFDRVLQEKKHILRRTAESFMSASVNDLQELFNAVLATRHSSLGDLFRDHDEQRIVQVEGTACL